MTVALQLFFISFLAGLHLGYSEWASFQFIGFFLIFAYSFLRAAVSVEVLLAFIALVTFGFLMCALSGQDEHYYFVMLRFAVAATILFHVKSTLVLNREWYDFLLNSVKMVAIINATLAMLQLLDGYFLRTGVFSLPDNWFSIEYGTLLGQFRSDLLEIDYFIRPSGFYSEPSALAAFGLMCVQAGLVNRDKYIYYLGIILIIVSVSVLGFIGVIAIHYSVILRSLSRHEGMLKFLLSFLILTSISFYFMGDRLYSVIGGEDASTGIRLTVPISIIEKNFSEFNFFGIQKYEIYKLMPDNISGAFDNWVLNQVMMFGLFGLIYIYAVLVIVPKEARIIWFMFFLLNGDPLYYDRIIIMTTLIAIINSYKSQSKLI